MAKENKHPYITSPGILLKTVEQLRKRFPAKLDSDILKKLNLAPNNESIIISTFKFLGIIDEKGDKTQLADTIFSKHIDQDFQKELEKVVKKSYKELFDLRGEDSWNLDRNTLIGFFRNSDNTSALTAQRQASAFETLTQLSGHGRETSSKTSNQEKKVKVNLPKVDKKNKEVKEINTKVENNKNLSPNNLGLTVRIEINLPAQGDQETYDRIFESIKKNLLNG
ncbi:DUF5343 domain-containing protein [Leptospira bandrabouensis]|uniref:DUF5343 domain-containing protein n=1 Tax=Leptospira bandrabouensis TaxID=2484903 RepID=UPI00223E6F60|nr:DUF5343 domain-containing protein [Leptospira bandrabouensis]MCW7479456.1 DUF5343 domain-containing protein [Leptospira bandrabouensis]MCW7487139.1 DUF5343 domain-containing protein [Leptospira bandrabouensis]